MYEQSGSTKLGDDIYVTSGWNGDLGDIYYIDLWRFTAESRLFEKLDIDDALDYTGSMELLSYKGFVLIVGNVRSLSGPTENTALFAYHPATGTITRLLFKPPYRTYNYGFVAVDDAVYVFGGRTLSTVDGWPPLDEMFYHSNLIASCPRNCTYWGEE